MAAPSKLAAGSPFNMHLLYEEGGDIKAATVQSTTGEGDAQSWQATGLSGKKLKLKAKANTAHTAHGPRWAGMEGTVG